MTVKLFQYKTIIFSKWRSDWQFVGKKLTAENFESIRNSADVILKHAEQLKTTVDVVAVANTKVVQNIDNVSAVTQEVSASALG